MNHHKFSSGMGALIAAALSASLSDAGGETVKVIPLELDGEGSIDGQIERAMEGAAAKHRETCEGCRKLHAEMNPDARELAGKELQQRHEKLLYIQKARHAAEDKELAATMAREIKEMHHGFEPKTPEAPAPDLTTYSREQVKKKHEQEREELAKRHAEQRDQLEKELAAVHGGQEGFMLFNAGEPILSSFNTDRGVLEEALVKLADPDFQRMFDMFDVDLEGGFEIRPVTKRTEQL